MERTEDFIDSTNAFLTAEQVGQKTLRFIGSTYGWFNTSSHFVALCWVVLECVAILRQVQFEINIGRNKITSEASERCINPIQRLRR
ncbi:hypothetical protein D3C71_1196260 [compost metagenome]